jgi:hypothetical protein
MLESGRAGLVHIYMESDRRKLECLVSLCTQRLHLVVQKLFDRSELPCGRGADRAHVYTWLRARERQRSE